MFVSDQEDLRLLLQVRHKNTDLGERKGISAFLLTFPFCLQRLLQCCRDDSLNVTVPMRMLEIFSSEKTYHPVIPDASLVTSLVEQILHYMVPKGNVSVICSVFVSFFKNVLRWKL